MTLTVGSLFSGIGGLDLGLERAGMQVRWHSEINEYAARVLAKNWPNVPNIGDVTAVEWKDVERVDLICGGFPCQDISKVNGAGAAKEGIAGSKSGLWGYFARAVRELQPRWVLVENVGAILVRGLDVVLADLAACGFDAEWDCLPAAAFGAPHIRDRFYLVAYATGERHRAPDETVFAGWAAAQLHGGWEAEPDVGRVADGVPARVDRLRALGNAVVPRAAEWIGRRILEVVDAEH